MKLFFGDSLTSAENNNFIGYVEKLKLTNFKNYGVSGTTLDSYSLYPVGSTDLLNMLIINESEVKKADEIYLEYGTNDISSVITGYVNIERVLISLKKCIDYIRQVNPKALISFILISNKYKNIKLFAKNQINYLNNDYLKDTGIDMSVTDWIENYIRFANVVTKSVDKVLYLFNDILSKDFIDDDNIHPNDLGYQLIADNLRKDIQE